MEHRRPRPPGRAPNRAPARGPFRPAPRSPASLPPLDDFCLTVARAVVGNPDALKVAAVEGSQLVVIELSAPMDEIGRIVGRDGRTIFAIRTLAEALAQRLSKRVIVDVQATGRRAG